MMETAITKDSRNQSDRRNSPTPIFSRFAIYGGQRKIIRRGYDKGEHLFVDLYSTRLFIAVLALLLLSVFDAYMTLTLIDRGSVYEANPFMAYFLDHGIFHFTRIGLPVAIKIYILIVAYEFYLFLM
jgi:hypothetical protein